MAKTTRAQKLASSNGATRAAAVRSDAGARATKRMHGPRSRGRSPRAASQSRKLTTSRLAYGIVETYGGQSDLLLDCDESSPRAAMLMLCNVLRVCRFIGVRCRHAHATRSRRGWHLRIILNRKFSDVERVALQILSGSDPAREMYNLIRVFSLAAHPDAHFGARWNVLFSRKLTR